MESYILTKASNNVVVTRVKDTRTSLGPPVNLQGPRGLALLPGVLSGGVLVRVSAPGVPVVISLDVK